MFGFENPFDHMPRSFNTQYRCFSVSMLPGNEREDVEKGGKIIMPPSALDILTRLNIVYPMLFKLTNSKKARTTHSGVLEFVADEGKVYLPYWMMRNLLLEEGDFVQVQSASLPIATYTKFQPQSPDFLDITNPKAVLENALRSFACLSTGDMIAIKYNEKIYEFLVMEAKPANAVSIIECDMQVDFAAPVGYVDPSTKTKVAKEDEQHEAMDDYAKRVDWEQQQIPVQVAKPRFPGEGNRLDGKKKKIKESSDTLPEEPIEIKRGIPDLNYKKGKITFFRKSGKPTSNEQQKQPESTFSAFSGQGKFLRKLRK